MPEVTVDDVLVAWRDVMADEALIVKDVEHMFEDADGSEVWEPSEAACACFAGGVDLAATRLGIDPDSDTAWEAYDRVDDALPVTSAVDAAAGRDNFTVFLRDRGHTACAEFLDRVIADRKREAAGV